MRHRITIQERSKTSDGYGGASHAWSAGSTVWSAIQHKSLAGSVGPGGQIADRSQIDFIIRQEAFAAVRQGDRIQYDGRTFLIDAVQNEDERGRFLRIVTTEQEFGT